MNQQRAHNKGGFTLVEMLAASIVMSLIAVTVLPVVMTLITRTADVNTDRVNIDRATYAMDRIVRLVREAPLTVADELDYTTATASKLEIDNAGGVELFGSSLRLIDDAGASHLITGGVSSFELKYLAMDGITETTDKTLIWQIRIKIVTDGTELRSTAFLRSRIGQE